MDIFLTSPWIPAEWVRAHGLVPRGIGSAANFCPGKGALSAGVCAFAEAAVQFAEGNGLKPADSAVIFSTSCDQLRRGFDSADGSLGSRAFLFNLPATWQSNTAVQLFRSELERLGRFLVSLGGQAPTMERLRTELEEAGGTRERLLRSLKALEGNDGERIGNPRYSRLEICATSLAREFAEAVAQFHWGGSFSPMRSLPPTDKIPLALVGGPFLASHWKWLDEIEAAGGWVAVNATETGERSLLPALPVNTDVWPTTSRRYSRLPTGATVTGEIDPFEVLVQGYFNHVADVFQRPHTRLYSWLRERMVARGVRGVVLWHYTGCDLWRAEAQSLRENFGLPVLLLEASEQAGNEPRELTRLQAFLEMLQ